MVTTQELAKLQAVWRSDPVVYAKQVFGAEPYDVQKKIFRMVRDNKNTCIKSCNGIGKTWTASVIAQWFLDSFAPSIVITTAPTFRQVKNLLWKEIREKRHENDLLEQLQIKGDVLDTAIKLAPNWFAIGISTDDESSFMGWHEKNIMIIKDECSGIPDFIQNAVEGCLTSENAKQLELGNPLVKSGFFFDHFSSSNWNKVSISAFDTPNFTKFGITVDDIREDVWRKKIITKLPYPTVITPEWVHGRFTEWGENSPLWQARVLGEFPDVGDDNVFDLRLLLASKEIDVVEKNPGVVCGIDVARFGDDRTVIYIFKDGIQLEKLTYYHKDLVYIGAVMMNLIKKHGIWRVVVDEGGVGGGLVDIMRNTKNESKDPDIQKCAITAVNFGSSPTEKDRSGYFNLRAEMYFNLKDLLEKRLIKIEDTGSIFNELVNTKYTLNSRGKFQIEKKDDYKARVGSSPDEADALILAGWAMKNNFEQVKKIFSGAKVVNINLKDAG